VDNSSEHATCGRHYYGEKRFTESDDSILYEGDSMSKEVLKVGWLASKSGEKCFHEFPVEGRPYRLPTWLINGSADGPTLVVTAGVHGAEYASIAAALYLGQSLDPKDLRGQVIVAMTLIHF
jgi:predicted deacylase